MWFKTRVGLTHVEGFYQINVGTTYYIAGVAYRAVTARRQETDFAPRGVLKSFWGGAVNYPIAGSYHLATFEDDENIEAAVGQCMGLILRAIEQNAAVCDLSGQGTRDGWNNKWLAIRWPS
jgi:hypothetical protein